MTVVEKQDVEEHLRNVGLDVRPLPRRPDATLTSLRHCVTGRSGPALFQGLMDAWPARTTWTPELFAATRGEQVVTALMNLPCTETLLPQDQKNYQRTLRFSEFLEHMLVATPEAPCYLAYTRADELLPSSDYDFEGLLDRSGGDTRVWIGSAGTRSMLHSDLKDNLFCQIWGHKRVVLIPWEHSRCVYPFPNNLVNSQIDLATVETDRFPRLRSAVLYAGTLAPGDLLYIPRGCWHDIRSLGPSISMNHWFGDGLGFRDYAALLARLGPEHWLAAAVDFVRHGVLGRAEPTLFLFSPPSTGRRLYDALRRTGFSGANDPVSEELPLKCRGRLRSSDHD
jgi:hypothetical protein